MSSMPHEHDSLPPARYISADRVIGQMAEFGRHRIDSLSASRVLVLGLMAGAFITAGALFSVHLSIGFDAPGAVALATGLVSRQGSSSWCCPRPHCSPKRTS